MPKISAIIHAKDDAQRLGRALESLRACDQVIVIDHGSADETAKVAREHGATLKHGIPGVEPGAYVVEARYDWVLCLLPNESLGEGLEASLFEWKESEPAEDAIGYCLRVREDTGQGWRALDPEPRLVNRQRINWTGKLPPDNCPGPTLEGELLRFAKP